MISTRDRGNLTEVVGDSPAFKAGLTTASKLIAVNGQEFAPELLIEAMRAAKSTRQPIELLIKTFHRYRLCECLTSAVRATLVWDGSKARRTGLARF